MAYTPTVWETGDVITAEKLNKAENGIAAANSLVCSVEFTDETHATIDQDYDDIVAAVRAGKPVIFLNDDTEEGILSHFTLLMASDAYGSDPNIVDLLGVQAGNIYKFSFEETDGVLTWSGDTQ